MATFVKGIGVENATAYKLFKKNGDQYTEIATAEPQKVNIDFNIEGYVSADGVDYPNDNVKHTTFIPISLLVDDEDGYCLRYLNYENEGYPKILFYDSSYNVVATINAEQIATDTVTAKWIKDKAAQKAPTATYVIFNSALNAPLKDYVTVNGIFFELDNYASVLPAGQKHYLVAKAIGEGDVDLNGDGVIYQDSDYFGDEFQEPLEYTA